MRTDSEPPEPEPADAKPGGFSLKLSFGRAPGEDIAPADDKADLPDPADRAEPEAWERLSRIGTGAYPDTARMHRLLRRVVLALALSVPVGLGVLGVATGQSSETVVFMVIGGAIVGAMLAQSVRG